MRFFLILFLFFTSCVHKSKKEENNPKSHYDEALQKKDRGSYIDALEILTELRKKFFYSRYNQKALLLTADIYFTQYKYPLAVESYKKHLNLYPDKQKDYVLYQLGLSYKNQLPHRAEHDLSLAEPALKAFDALLNLKTSSPYKEKAQKEKQEIEEKKASRELKAALFFKGQGWHKASLKRVQDFIKNYPKSRLLPKALLTGFQLAGLLNKNPEEFKTHLIKSYPDSEEAKSLQEKNTDSFFSQWKKKLL